MNILMGYGLGLTFIGIATFQITRIMQRSIIIKKRDFEKIEKSIRLDERKKVLASVNNK